MIPTQMIPGSMRAASRWVTWQYEYRDGKRTKVLHNPETGARASSTDPSTWTTYEEAGRVREHYAGIGFVLGDGWIGVDWDHVRDSKTGEWDAGVLDEILSLGTYAEVSPSGSGAHAILLGDTLPGDRSRNGDGPEFYASGRFFTVTGDHIGGTPAEVQTPPQNALETLYRRYIPDVKEQAPNPAPAPAGDLNDDEIVRRAENARNGAAFSRLFHGDWSGYPSQSEADAALCFHLAFWTQNAGQIDRIFRQSGLCREKWDREDYRNRTIGRALVEVREKYSPGCRVIKNRIADDRPVDPEATDEAAKILEAGHALETMKVAFHREHEGDDLAAECLALVTACQSAINTDGLFVTLSGETGDGKTHTVESWLKQIPDDYKLAGSFSDKALFYLKTDRPLIIYIDDRALSEDLNATVKNATSHYQEQTQHFTVNKDRSGAVMSLPGRCAFIFSRVDDVGDDQLLDRCLSVWIDSSVEHREQVTRLMLKSAAMPRRAVLDDDHTVRVCRDIWSTIKEREFFVNIPYAERIVFEGLAFRNQHAFLDMIRCYAILDFQNRNPVMDDDGITEIDGCEEDFRQAVRLFSRLSSDSGDLVSKLTPAESAVIEHLKQHETESFFIKDVQTWLRCTAQRARAILHGRNERGVSYGGLLGKCPAISDRKASVSYESDGGARRTTNRRIFDVDRDLLRSWSRGHAIYLRHLDNDSNHNNHTTTTVWLRQKKHRTGRYNQSNITY